MVPFTTGLCMPKNAALAALLHGQGAIVGDLEGTLNAMSIAADPNSGASRNVDISGQAAVGGLVLVAALQAVYNANTGNPAAPTLLGIINSIVTG